MPKPDAADLACLLGVLLICAGVYFIVPAVLPFFLILVGIIFLLRGIYCIVRFRRDNRWVG